MKVIIDAEGTTRFVGTLDALDTDLCGCKARASTILPVSRAKRVAFRLLRLLPVERVAAWTRTWRGPWEARILATGETFTAYHRSACLAWERWKLEAML